jgi:plasmid stability protein
MGAILVRGLDQKTIERLKERARLNGRSLQQEVKVLLERAADTLTMREARRLSER